MDNLQIEVLTIILGSAAAYIKMHGLSVGIDSVMDLIISHRQMNDKLLILASFVEFT